MTPERQLELRRLAMDLGSPILHRLMQWKDAGMPDEEWEFLAVKSLAEALAEMTKTAVDLSGRSVAISYVGPAPHGGDGFADGFNVPPHQLRGGDKT